MSAPRASGRADPHAPPPPPTRLEGEVLRIVFERPADDFRILRVQRDGAAASSAPATVLGTIPELRRGQRIRAEGRWIEDARFGTQFRATWIEVVPPTSALGVERFLASGVVKGIGPTTARRIVAHLGENALSIIEREPARLAEVPGLGRDKRTRIVRALEEQASVRDVLAFLHAHGLGTALAQRIVKTYGRDATRRIQANPYTLATDVRGIGFLKADAIAQSLGLPHDAPARMQAGVLHLLDEATQSGHAYVPEPKLVADCASALGVETDRIAVAVRALASDGRLVLEATGGDDTTCAVYLRALWEAECDVAALLARLAATPARGPALDADQASGQVAQHLAIELAPAQREALRRSLTSKVLVLTGGPGTGKTTIVRAVVELFARRSATVLLAAPTGRAARRLAETTGRETSTLHRLLEFQPATGTFDRDAANRLAADLVVVDEVSMVDLPLARALLAALDPRTRLLLVGDADQLPSVGPGAVLADVIASDRLPVVRLTEIFRQAQGSGIVVNAHRVNQGEVPRRPEEGEAAPDDFYVVERSEPEAALDLVVELVAQRIPARFGLDPITQIQVLTPMRRGLLGAEHLNDVLRARLNPEGQPIGGGGERAPRVGDRVMQLANDYHLDIMNGEIGRVEAVAGTDGQGAIVRFDHRRVEYGRDQLAGLGLAYACSIHKAQGSEYPAVVIPLHTQHFVMLRRNLLYTAITRGKRVVVVVGSRKALTVAVREATAERRYTRLAERLRAALG